MTRTLRSEPPLPRGGPPHPVRPPSPGVAYTQVHQGPGFAPVRSWVGLAFAFLGYALLVPVINQALLAVFWLADGRQTSFTDFYSRATSYQMPWGMVAGHLALASLILISWAMTRGWQRRPGLYLASVQPGLRWRYLVLCLPVAAIVLNLMFWGGNALAVLGGDPWPTAQAQAHWGWWLLVIVLFSPLQAAGEEFFFRGYLMQGLGSLFGQRWVGVIVSALVFAFFHGVQNVWLFIDRFGFGLIIGALVLATGGLEAAIAAHVANNLFAFGYATFFGGVAATRALQSIGPVQAVLDLVGFGAIALVCWALGRRLNLATTTPATAA